MQYDITIIGGGIVGLATAYKLLQKDASLKIAVIEKENRVAVHQTGNNSGVLHSGIYYKPGSLKAKNCIEGYNMMVNFCRDNQVAYDVCGKIIVATDKSELPTLHGIYERGIANGLNKIRKITAAEANEIEPHVNCLEAILVPYAGIVSYRDVSEKLAALIQSKGGEIILNSPVKNIAHQNGIVTVETTHQSFQSKFLINCAGLYSDKIATFTQPVSDFMILPFRGEYYELKPEKQFLVNHLIYPVPNTDFPFLGVHFTRMIHGGIEAGPNAVLAFRREGYKNTDVHLGELTETLLFPGFRKITSKYWKTGWMELRRSFSKKLFVKALQKLIPEITENDLVPGGSGVRAQACDRNGNLIDDFYFIESAGEIHVCNAPSPAATSALSIGEHVANMYFRNTK